MQRSSNTPAIVLRKARVGEIHKALTLLTPARGLLSVMAYGALKFGSRLATASEPFHLLKAYLYHDPVKDQYKLTDVESLQAHDELRRSVAKFYTASLWAETCLRSYGGGQESSSLFDLLAGSLSLLDRLPAGREPALSLQFLARFLIVSGHRLDLEQCGRCGLGFEPLGTVFVTREEGSLVCASCRGDGAVLSLPPGARRYLAATLEMPLAQASAVGLEQASLAALRAALYLLVQSSLEAPLKTLDCAAGFL
ncbi:MAG: DNA repair protein RecO [Spirochaetes bacterium RBG_16_67_19]|nr:MAG: DNA repair protein RecO [Spirochaetes bacterium GWB1_66_5]OHD73075.1 MAG: DNA repair protein RecO [Spirochaetes bacterium RBG_16_67_19]